MKPTKEQIGAYLNIIKAMADAIKELGEVPAGTLYANVMSKMDLSQFERIIGHLTGAGIVRRQPCGLLTWIGPK